MPLGYAPRAECEQATDSATRNATADATRIKAFLATDDIVFYIIGNMLPGLDALTASESEIWRFIY